jgi:hypothetical protein
MTLVYTRRMLAVRLLSAATADAVVPAGKVWVVRNVVAIADGAASQSVAAIYAPNPITVALAVTPANQLATFNAETRIVLQAGETLHAQAVAGNWFITVTGYEFTL